MPKRMFSFFVGYLFLMMPLSSCSEKVTNDTVESDYINLSLRSNTEPEEVKTFQVLKDKVPTSEPTWFPEKKGYTFAGWFLDRECTKEYIFGSEAIQNHFSLFAGYSKDIVLIDKGKVSRVTGSTLAGEGLISPNNTAVNWNLGGTDLGIIWEMANGEYGILFGDSYGADFRPVGGGPGGASDWRSNVLAFSNRTDFENGLVFSGMLTRSLDPKRAIPIIERENYYGFTYIPTAAISLNGIEYMHFMYWEVGSRDRVTQNYSSFYRSSDNGRSWEACRGSISFDYNSNFAMVGLGKRDNDPYCYMLGAMSGNGYRLSTAKLARFKYANILNKSKYEFWNSSKGMWVVGDESAATTVLDGTVGELSLMYLEKYGRWLTMYFDNERYAICYRSAARINGPWSEERVLCSGFDNRYSQLYGSFIHPACGKSTNGELYWTMSQWQPYNVYFMKSTIEYAN